MFSSAPRKGITPVVATVLLLMMTVAAAGAAYTWFTQMQGQLQTQATSDLQTEFRVKDLQCNAKPENTVKVSIKNSGSREVDLRDVDAFIDGPDGHLNVTITDMDLSTPNACNGDACAFGEPGGFAAVVIDLSDPAGGQPGSGSASPPNSVLVPGSFYKVELSFTNADQSISAGGCLAD